jgi:hypothetical protein
MTDAGIKGASAGWAELQAEVAQQSSAVDICDCASRAAKTRESHFRRVPDAVPSVPKMPSVCSRSADAALFLI